MKMEAVRIVDLGRGPQIEGHRLTVMDVFYYLHRGYDFDFVHRAMPSLTREQFDAIVEYVKHHHDELVAKDRRVEERIRLGIEEQKAKGLHHEIDESVPVAERAARLKERLHRKLAEPAENNGGHPSSLTPTSTVMPNCWTHASQLTRGGNCATILTFSSCTSSKPASTERPRTTSYGDGANKHAITS